MLMNQPTGQPSTTPQSTKLPISHLGFPNSCLHPATISTCLQQFLVHFHRNLSTNPPHVPPLFPKFFSHPTPPHRCGRSTPVADQLGALHNTQHATRATPHARYAQPCFCAIINTASPGRQDAYRGSDRGSVRLETRGKAHRRAGCRLRKPRIKRCVLRPQERWQRWIPRPRS